MAPPLEPPPPPAPLILIFLFPQPEALNLMTHNNRPPTVEKLYEKAAPKIETPVLRPDSLDASRWNDADYGRLMALGATLRRQKRRQRTAGVLDIEMRRPASLSRLRDWLTDDQSKDAVLDDLATTVGPDNNRRCSYATDQSTNSTKLPSPEEKAKAAAKQVFTAHVVRLDVSGSQFQRMTQFRRSLQHFDYQATATPASGNSDTLETRNKKNGRNKKKRQKRRNTIAGCDAAAVTNESASRNQKFNLINLLRASMVTTPTPSSKANVTSTDISYEESTSITLDQTSTSHASSELVVQVSSAHFVTATRTRSGALHNTISRLRRLGTDHTFNPDVMNVNEQVVEIHQQTTPPGGDVLYELISSPGPTAASGGGGQCSDEKDFGTLGNGRQVKLRGCAAMKDASDRSSSGNWSASGGSSCSTRASPRINNRLTSNSTSTSRGAGQQGQQPAAIVVSSNRCTASPLTFVDDVDSVLSGDDCSAASTTTSRTNGNAADMETSSVYSCDAEGYYTSFHIDSGLKTLKVTTIY